ncbi:MAG: endonuclease [Bacteroidales bacterium]|nr:endonuclease [Bacteroidales bacterium]
MKKTLLKRRVSFLAALFLLVSQIAFSQIPPENVNGEDLKTWLRTNYYDGKHQTLGYTSARRYLYNYIDNENGVITCVYSGLEVNSAYGGTTTYPAPINCEHTIPQSFFNESDPMVSDIHHLYPTYENWNSTRSNYPLTDIDDNSTAKWMYLSQSQTTIPTSNIDLYSEYASSTFEPREDHKGNAARAIFYFYTMYPTQAGNLSQVGDINVFYQWHLDDPVDAAEIERNGEVETYQGNRNPFIDYPELVARAWSLTPVNTPPSTPSLQFSSTSSSINLTWNNVSDEDGYKIYKSTSGSSYSLLTDLTANSTGYTDHSVSESITYYYYILAYNTYGNSSNSNIVSGQLSTGGTGTTTDLLFSEYIEGSSYNKGIEIANFTGSAIDLSNFSVRKQTNGAGDWGTILTLSGTLANGDVYVIVNSSASSEMKAVADLQTGVDALTFNGNDPLGLFKNGILIDMLGTLNSSADFAKDLTLVRNSNVTSPNTTYTTTEWTSYAIDTYTYLGSHTVDGGIVDTEAPSAPSSLSSSSITETSVNLAWIASTDNIGVSSYDIYRNGSLLTNTVNTNYSVTGLTASTSYSFYVKAKDAAGNVSTASNTINVTTSDIVATYCSSQGNNSTYEWIATVAIGSYSNVSGAANYTDYTSEVISLEAGSIVNVSLTPGFSSSTYNEYWKIWIDYNSDGDFEDANELAFDAGSLSNTAVTGNINILSTATGSTRMRVSMKYNGAQTACEAFSYGEVEDYTVSFSEAVADTEAPSIPSSLTASNITSSSATISWNASSDNVGVTEYEIYQNKTLLGNSANTNYSVTGLSASTQYSYTIKAKDAAGNTSALSSTLNVTTSSVQLTYCSTIGNNINYEWIDLVSIGSINNVTTANGGYADFTNLSTTVSPGTNISINVSCGFKSSSYTEYWHIWIDWNQNGTFDSNEEMATGSSSSAGTLTYNFTVPTTALAGTTRMRVTMKYNSAATPCETFSYGEVEDYTINVSSAKSAIIETTELHNSIDTKLYPNPASSYTTLVIGNDNIKNVSYRIVDLHGRIMISKNNIRINGNHEEQIDISKLNTGLYYIMISDNKLNETHKLVVE